MSWDSAAGFYHQLGLMTRTGVPLPNAIELAGRASSGTHRTQATRWHDACAGGEPLATVLARDHEPAFAVALIDAGERSGRLPELSERVAAFYAHAVAMRRLIVGRLIYPFFLLHAALMMPLVPGVVMGTTNAIWLLAGPAVLWAIILGVVMAARSATRAEWGARLALAPGAAFLCQPVILSSTCRVLSAGLQGGMLIPEALTLAAPACGNAVFGARLRIAAEQVRSGQLPNLTAALTDCGFPRELTGIIGNGEIAGKLDSTLDQVAAVTQEQFSSRSQWAAKMFAGAIYGAALLFAAITVVRMFQQVYLEPINTLSQEIEQGQ